MFHLGEQQLISPINSTTLLLSSFFAHRAHVAISPSYREKSQSGCPLSQHVPPLAHISPTLEAFFFPLLDDAN